MSGTEITLECGHVGCRETFKTGRSFWKDAVIEGRQAGWNVESNPELCPEHSRLTVGAHVVFRDSEASEPIPQTGHVRAIFEGTDEHPDALEYDVVLDDGGSVVAWPDELALQQEGNG